MTLPRHLLYALCFLAAALLILPKIFPVFLPFFIGFLLSAAAEPVVEFLGKRAHFPRALAAITGVTVLLGALFFLLAWAFSLLFRQLSQLADLLPGIFDALQQGLDTLEGWLLARGKAMPGNSAALFTTAVTRIFSDGSTFMEHVSTGFLGLAGSTLAHLPGSALSLGTAILSSYLFSMKMPALRRYFGQHTGEKIRLCLEALRSFLKSYLQAQAILSGILFLILTAGLLILRVPLSPLWAFVITLVDAAPILGTGTVLLPWSFVCLLQHDPVRSVGLLLLYAAAVLIRTALEPKLVGNRLGLDPLLTLAALYAGFRLWGIPGLILAPLMAALFVRGVGFFRL